MGTGAFAITLLVLFRILPVVVGFRACRKFGRGAVRRDGRAQIPDKGVGAVIAARRGAVIFLEENCRQCGRCRLGREGRGMSRELVFVLRPTRPEFASPKTCRKQLVGPM